MKTLTSCVLLYSFEEHSRVMRTLYYQNLKRNMLKYKIPYLTPNGVMGEKNIKSRFFNFLVWLRKTHSSNCFILHLKLKEGFERMFQEQNLSNYPFWGVKRGEIMNSTLPLNSGWKNHLVSGAKLENQKLR